MKILILGKSGQVGWELQRAFVPLGEVVALGRQDFDSASPAAIRTALRAVAPDLLLNASAYTAVDDAEKQPEIARAINEDLVSVLAECALEQDFGLVHYSTDYVFDGLKDGAYTETDATNPQNVYGQTKRAGEQAITASGCRHLIFRTSWLHSTRRKNFVKTILRLSMSREEIRIVQDQVGTPTSAELVADVSALAVQRIGLEDWPSGIYHLTATGSTNWYDFACLIVERARDGGVALTLRPDGILPISTSEFITPAKRPANSRLDTQSLRKNFNVTLPDWQFGVERTITDILEGNING